MTLDILAENGINRGPHADVQGLDPVDILLALHDYARQTATYRAGASQPGYKPVYRELSRGDAAKAIRQAQKEDWRNPVIHNLGDFVLNVGLSGLPNGELSTASFDSTYGRDAGRTAIDLLRIRLYEEQLAAKKKAREQEEARLNAEYTSMAANSRDKQCLDIRKLGRKQRVQLLVLAQHHAAHAIDDWYRNGWDVSDYVGTMDEPLWLITPMAARQALRHHTYDDELSVLGNVRMGNLGLNARSVYVNVSGKDGFDTRFGEGSMRQVMRELFHPQSDEWLVHHDPTPEDGNARTPVVSLDIFESRLETIRFDHNEHMDSSLVHDNSDVDPPEGTDTLLSDEPASSPATPNKWRRLLKFMRADSGTKKAIVYSWADKNF